MIRDIFNDIVEQKDIRQNLIKLKAELKDGFNKTALLYQMGSDYTIFDRLLLNEDAKVRKNTALIMGELGVPCFLTKLYDAYNNEEQLFVKSSYLVALKNFDYTNLIPKFKERLEYLGGLIVDDNNKKHISEEIRILSDLIIEKEGIKSHKFTGYNVPSTLVLLTNRNFRNITLNQLSSYKAKEFNAGVIVKADNISEILDIRTYSEVLFMLDELKVCENDPLKAANGIANSEILEFLGKRHKGDEPYYFRIELKSKLELDKKSAFTKRLSSEIERLTGRKLINSTSNYEFEIRLIENKEGKYNILIKLYTFKDERFFYRINTTATSIAPVSAALIANLAKDYLVEEGRVLDPFCGVGTMLIERHKLVKANTMYGLDVSADAIKKAKDNTETAHLIAHYINRDFFDFKHEYLFDEIFTNMPRVMGHKDEDEIFSLYQKFFFKAKEHLDKNGIIVLYSHNKDFVYQLMNRAIYKIEKEFEISKKEGAYLLIIRYL
jgi:tRNA G10  N-methylase Trm11